jgi:hypothetical protein
VEKNVELLERARVTVSQASFTHMGASP